MTESFLVWSKIYITYSHLQKEMSSEGRSNFIGKVIDPEKTWNGDITLYVERFEDDGKKRRSVVHDKRLFLRKETKVLVQGRFYEATDLHFYQCYRNTHPETRMAICEEIERKIVIN